MAVNRVDAEKEIAAPPERVYTAIADYAQRPQWLPSNFSDLVVEQGGRGAGTVARYRLKVGNRERTYQMRLDEPQPGATLTESDTASSLVTTWTVSPHGSGSHVALHTEWQGAGGVGGFFERLFAPGALKRVYEDELARLDGFVSGQNAP